MQYAVPPEVGGREEISEKLSKGVVVDKLRNADDERLMWMSKRHHPTSRGTANKRRTRHSYHLQIRSKFLNVVVGERSRTAGLEPFH